MPASHLFVDKAIKEWALAEEGKGTSDQWHTNQQVACASSIITTIVCCFCCCRHEKRFV